MIFIQECATSDHRGGRCFSLLVAIVHSDPCRSLWDFFSGSGELLHLEDVLQLPQWPQHTAGLLGKYSQATVAADNVLCSEIGRHSVHRLFITLIQGHLDSRRQRCRCDDCHDDLPRRCESTVLWTWWRPFHDHLQYVRFRSRPTTDYDLLPSLFSTTRRCQVIDAREVAPLVANETMYKGHPGASQLGDQ